MFNGTTNFYNLNNENFHNFLMEMYKKIDLLDKDTNYIRNHLIDEMRKELRKIISNGELIVDIESVVDDFLVNGLEENKIVTDIKKKLVECKSQSDTNKSQLTQMNNIKMNKNTTNIAVSQINKNLGKFDQTYMTDEFLQQIAGNAPLNQTPADNSLTTKKFVNESVTFDKRTKNGIKIQWLNQTPLNFNTKSGVLENNGGILGSIRIGNYGLYGNDYVTFVSNNFPLTLSNDFGFIMFDFESKSLVIKAVSDLNENNICIGWYYKSKNRYYLDTNYTVDGMSDIILNDNSINSNKITKINSNLSMMLTYPLNFNTTTKQLENPNGPNQFGLTYGKTRLSSNQILGFPLQLGNLGYIFFDTSDNTFKNFETVDKVTNPENSILIGSYYFEKAIFNINILFTVDGKYYSPKNNLNIPSDVYGKYGKVMSIIGDSMVAGDNSEGYPWHSYMKELLGFETLNVDGIGGTCIARGENNSFLDRFTSLNNNADVICVWGGQNDFGHSIPLGNINSTEDTNFYGALKILCEELIEKYPGRNIFFITPTPRNYNMFPADGCAKGQITNKNGNKLIEYVNAIKEVCNEIYNLPVLDLYHNTVYANSSAVCSNVLTDGLHFNKKGHKDILAKRISNFIKYTF
jgi:lysophospholipase L1-like esterase|nr:MAG TPA: GDSL like Lipase Acylhydrolase [Caudoviricetes sp.]